MSIYLSFGFAIDNVPKMIHMYTRCSQSPYQTAEFEITSCQLVRDHMAKKCWTSKLSIALVHTD